MADISDKSKINSDRSPEIVEILDEINFIQARFNKEYKRILKRARIIENILNKRRARPRDRVMLAEYGAAIAAARVAAWRGRAVALDIAWQDATTGLRRLCGAWRR